MGHNNYIRLTVLTLLVCCLVPISVQGQGFGVGNYQVLSSTRVGRTQFQYVLSVSITNTVAAALGVTAQVFSTSPNTVIVQGSASFGDLTFGAAAVSTNTITIIQDRVAAFDPSQLQWFISVKSMPLELTVIAPLSGFLTNGTNVVVSGTVGPAVDGVLVGPTTVALTGTNFTGTFRLEEGKNTISVLATNIYGGSGLINVFVTRDTTPPILNIESPTNGAVLSSRQVTVIGLINDIVPGTVNPEQATVMVNGLSATILNRSYAIPNVLLVPGKNTITAMAQDRAGNQSQRQIEVTFLEPASQKRLVRLAGEGQTGIINTTLPQPLLVELVDSDGVVQTNQPVTFAINRNDGTLFASPDSGRTLTVLTDDKGQARVLYQLGTRSGVANNQVTVASPGVDGQLQFCANAQGSPPAKISPLIPETQVGEVSKPLPQPWTAYVTDAGGNPVVAAPVTFIVSQGGGNLAGVTTVTTNTDSDGRASAILTLGPDEGINNNVVLAGISGLTNSSAVFTASSQTPGAVSDTRVVGVVLDNANRPMSNILCMIRGSVRAAVTDQQGQFILTHAPVGAITLIVDGKNRGYPGEWHDLTFNMVTVAGRDTRLDRPIYMVQVDTDSSALVGGNQDVTLHLKGFPGSSLTVYAHSLRDANNQPITNLVTWTQVNAERIPMAPPQGSQPVLTTAILPSGYRFNPPAKMCIPNSSGLPSGQILELYGFDHDIGNFVSVGTATVSSDGSLICSDPGFGVVKSGWHPVVPPPPPCTPVCGGPPADTDCIKYQTIPPATKCDCPTYKPKTSKITKVEAKVEGKDKIDVCTNDTVNFTATATAENCSSLEYEWDFGDGSAKVKAAGTSHKYANPGAFTATVTVKCGNNCDTKTGTVTVNAVKVDLTVASATLNLCDNQTLTATLNPAAASATDYKFEIRRTNSGSWFTLQSGNSKTFTSPARVAGSFKLRLTATLNGHDCKSDEKDAEVQFPTYATISGNADVVTKTDTAWANTKAATLPNARREEGFWIRYNSQTCKFEFTATIVGPVVDTNNTGSVNLPARPADSPAAPDPNVAGATYSVASFHTYTPMTYRSGTRGVGPSGADQNVDSNIDKVPGLVYDYVESPAGSGTIPGGHPLNSAAQLYPSGLGRRPTP